MDSNKHIRNTLTGAKMGGNLLASLLNSVSSFIICGYAWSLATAQLLSRQNFAWSLMADGPVRKSKGSLSLNITWLRLLSHWYIWPYDLYVMHYIGINLVGVIKKLLCTPSYSSVNGTDLGLGSGSCSASNGMDGQVTSSSCSPALSHVVNGEATPNSTPVHQPSGSDTESRTGESFFFLFCISEWLRHIVPLKTFKCYKTLQIYPWVQEWTDEGLVVKCEGHHDITVSWNSLMGWSDGGIIDIHLGCSPSTNMDLSLLCRKFHF